MRSKPTDSARIRDKLLGFDRSKSCRLHLVRHGEAANVADGVFRYNGHVDVDVSPKGVRQIERVARFLKDKPISAVYCSDLKRAKKGAEAIARYHGLSPGSHADFREIKMGIWEGLTYGEIQERFPEEVEKKYNDFIYYRVPGGENLVDVQRRAVSKLREFIALNQGKGIVLVGHGGMNMVLLCDAMNLGFESFFRITQTNGCLNIIDYFGGTSVVRLMNGLVEEW